MVTTSDDGVSETLTSDEMNGERALAAVEKIASSLEKLADAQSRLATVAEQNSAIFEGLKPYIELVPQRLMEMIENGFGSRIVK